VAAAVFAPHGGGPGTKADDSLRRIAARHRAGAEPAPQPALPSAAPTATATVTATGATAAAAPAATTETATAAAVKANELGEVPVLMYHRIQAKPHASLDRTPTELRDELTRLAREGYVPVTAAEYVSARMPLPAGRHPVVLTFDDGSSTHFALDAQGLPQPDTAVGVIMGVAAQNPGFRPVATFFVNHHPFTMGDSSAAVRWLVQHGFEVANHTMHHLDLAQRTKKQRQQEIGSDQKMIIDMGAPPPITFAFPFGAFSHLAWADHGTAGGATWNFAGMFLAGWKPADSPYLKGYDPLEIPRIRSEDKIKEGDCKRFCSTAWLDWLAKNPDKRYTSDGDPAVISYPAAKAGFLAARYASLGRAY
jgi:peptidoglycan/xylan/chitin deacetylase (PgdA/CDA1 family)